MTDMTKYTPPIYDEHYAATKKPDAQASECCDLLPCPFCGGTDLFAERKDLSETVIQCNDCGVFGPGGCPENDDDLEREEAEDLHPGELMARRRWNERAR